MGTWWLQRQTVLDFDSKATTAHGFEKPCSCIVVAILAHLAIVTLK